MREDEGGKGKILLTGGPQPHGRAGSPVSLPILFSLQADPAPASLVQAEGLQVFVKKNPRHCLTKKEKKAKQRHQIRINATHAQIPAVWHRSADRRKLSPRRTTNGRCFMLRVFLVLFFFLPKRQ